MRIFLFLILFSLSLTQNVKANEKLKIISVGNGEIVVDYFYSFGCRECLSISENLFKLAKNNMITVNLYNIGAEDPLGPLLEYVLFEYYGDNIVEFEALHRNLLRMKGDSMLKVLHAKDLNAFNFFTENYKNIDWDNRNILTSILISQLKIEKTPFITKSQ